MRLASGRAGGWRVVGQITADGTRLQPLTLDPPEAALGVLGIVCRMAIGAPTRPTGAAIPLSQVKLEAPAPRPLRNVFCVGKNYHDHAHEFARSGFDSSAASGAIPEAPIIFSKVPESVTGPGTPIRFDPAVSTAIDYEAELAVVIGKAGRRITREKAMEHVWGYTIINDVTARDVQGRHKQWLLGKSFDSFCPMGPWLVSADEIDPADTAVKCWVNGELRQDANTRDFIFDIPTVIEAISAGITLLPGDLIATGTPAGVGIGFKPPKYLKHGDVVRIEIAGVGVLENPVVSEFAGVSTQIIERMAVEVDGSGDAVILVHGLGGTSNVFTPLMGVLAGRQRTVRPGDLPGSGRSPAGGGKLTIQGFVDAILRMAKVLGIERAHFVGHSMGTIVCQHLAVQQPRLARSLFLVGPLLAPPDAARKGLLDRAGKARSEGMAPIADLIVQAATSTDTKSNQPVTVALVREMLMRQDVEGYARTCEALAEAGAADIARIGCPTVLLTGDEDAVAPPSEVRAMAGRIAGARATVFSRCGHWATFERAAEVNAELKAFYAGRV